METMFAPWRMEYLVSEKPNGCVFCKSSMRSDDYVVHEGRACFVMLNRYPYVGGHLMIIPHRHLGGVEEMTPEERTEMFSLLDVSIKVLKEAMNPNGFNVGMNLGRTAGAGVAEHIHMHLIPRWDGDTNFMSVVGHVRVIPEDLSDTAARLAPLFKKYIEEDVYR